MNLGMTQQQSAPNVLLFSCCKIVADILEGKEYQPWVAE